MAKREILAGSTDQTIDIFIQDSSSTVGAGLTGLAFNTAGLTCYYRKGATGTPAALTLATQTVGGAHSDGGFVAVDGTNCPGQYRLDLSDTIVASAGMVTLYLRGATNMVPCVVEIEVVSVNKFDSVRMGLTALPNAAAGANGGLPTGNASGQVTVGAYASGQLPVRVIDTGTVTTSVSTTAFRDTSKTTGDTDYYKGLWVKFTSGNAVGQTRQVVSFSPADDQFNFGEPLTIAPGVGATYEILPAGGVSVEAWDGQRNLVAGTTPVTDGDLPANFASLGINASGHVSRVTLTDTVTTYTGNTPQTGDSYARLGAPAGASVSADIAAVKTDTGNLVTRIPAALFSGITSLAQWLGLIAGKQTGNNTARTEIRATGAGSGTFDETTDSVEAIRDRGDAAWTTGGGGGGTDWTADEKTAIKSILGVPASGTTPDDPTTGILDTIRDSAVAIKAKTDQLTFTTANRVDSTAVSVSDKTGYGLASTGLDSIAVTAPSAVATTFPGMVVQLWRRFFKKTTLNATQLRTYADDGTTVVTTQAVSDDGTTQTQGASS